MRSILEILVEVLATPSEPVQRAVSNCLPPLMAGLSADKPYLETLVARLLKQLSHQQYGHRCCYPGGIDAGKASIPHGGSRCRTHYSGVSGVLLE